MADSKLTTDTSTPGGVQQEAARLKTHSSASMAELQEFLRRFEGKSPQEVLGIVSESGLLRCTVLATFGFLILLIVLTVVPYVMRGDSASGTATADDPAAEQDAGTATPAAPDAAPDVAGDTAPAARPTTGDPELDRAVNSMGIGESKEAAPDSNPLEQDLDSLLDGVR